MLFAGSLRAGKRCAAIRSLIQSAKLYGNDPYDYPKDVLTRLLAQQNSTTGEVRCIADPVSLSSRHGHSAAVNIGSSLVHGLRRGMSVEPSFR
jgi:hypothetical protein